MLGIQSFKFGGYVAPKGWQPKNPDEDYIITYLDVEMIDEAKDKFEEVAAACAAESSTET